MGPCYDKVGDLIRRGRDIRALSPTPLLLWENTERRQLFANQKSPHQKFNLLTPLSQTSQSSELWETNVCHLSQPVYGTSLWQPELTKDRWVGCGYAFQLPEISTKTSRLKRDMKAESWPRAFPFKHQTCSHGGGFGVVYSRQHQIKGGKKIIQESRAIACLGSSRAALRQAPCRLCLSCL